MAISSSDKIKAIIFLIVSALLMVVIIFSLVGTQWMKQKDHYYIEFSESLGGLSTGSSVRFHGIKVGCEQRSFPFYFTLIKRTPWVGMV